MKICAVDLNISEHLAVCTIQTVKGTVIATRFIGGGKHLHGLRKRLLGRIARNRGKTGITASGEQDNAALWTKIRAIDEDTAHQVSHRIIQFAQAHGASILVFEHLAHFKPQKGKYSKRGNEKRSSACREVRESGRCSRLPGCQTPRKAIYPPGKAWSWERAGYVSGDGC